MKDQDINSVHAKISSLTVGGGNGGKGGKGGANNIYGSGGDGGKGGKGGNAISCFALTLDSENVKLQGGKGGTGGDGGGAWGNDDGDGGRGGDGGLAVSLQTDAIKNLSASQPILVGGSGGSGGNGPDNGSDGSDGTKGAQVYCCLDKSQLYRSSNGTLTIDDTCSHGAYGKDANGNVYTDKIDLSQYSHLFNADNKFIFVITMKISEVDDGRQQVNLYNQNTFMGDADKTYTDSEMKNHGWIMGAEITDHGKGFLDKSIYDHVVTLTATGDKLADSMYLR